MPPPARAHSDAAPLERPGPYRVGGVVVGLVGTGLVLEEVGRGEVTIPYNGTFSFGTAHVHDDQFSVRVKTQPTVPHQHCVVRGGAGVVASGNVTTITVNCSADDVPSGDVTGLLGRGLVLEDSANERVVVAANGLFAFPKAWSGSTPWAVKVVAQPSNPKQTCAIGGGGNPVLGDEPMSVTCVNDLHAVGGTASGLVGTGLVLQNNAGDDLHLGKNGTFDFSTPVASGAVYAVTIKTQPTNPAQTCGVSGGTGTIVGGDVSSVTVNCAPATFTVGGTASGVAGTGLVLDGSNLGDVAINANGTFAHPIAIASGKTFSVKVKKQPTSPSQTCVLDGGSGKVTTANVTTITLGCTTNEYDVGGVVSGLTGSGLVLQNNGADNTSISNDGPYAFKTKIPSGAPYHVTVLSQPTNPSQTCTVANGTATVANANIKNVAVHCVTNSYTVGGTITGLLGGGLVLRNNGIDDLAVSGDGAFTFASKVKSSHSFAVTVAAQPTSPSQTCAVSAGAGTVTNGNVVTISVHCATNSYAIGGTATELSGTGLVLQNNGSGDLTINGDGAFAFGAPVESGQPYAVTVRTQPTNPSQTCSVANGSGTVGGGDVSDVGISCVTNEYFVGGVISGLAGSGLVLRDNGGDDLPVTTNGTFKFPTKVKSGGSYSVTVAGQPTTPWQTCTVTGDAGAVVGSDIVTIDVNCTTNAYTIGGTINGLATSEIVVDDNGADGLLLNADGTFVFSTPVLSGAGYRTAVAIQPVDPNRTCFVANAAGTVGGANVSDVTVTCSLGVPNGHRYFGSAKTTTAPWHERDGARLEYFQGKYWLLGGWWPETNSEWGADGTTNSVWSSPDLVSWTQELAHDPNPPTSGPGARWRRRHTFMSCVLNGYLWVLGGDAADGTVASDVWRSPDGVTWERVAATSPWGPVYLPIFGLFGGYMHVMGGFSTTDSLARAEHWRSADGVTWERLPDMPFTRAAVTNAVVKNDRLFVIGGKTGDVNTGTMPTDTWAWNGAEWHQTSPSAPWVGRQWIATASYDDRLWVLTGSSPHNLGGLRYSEDSGITWVEATQYPWPGSHADGITVGPDGIVLVSGSGLGQSTYTLERLPDEIPGTTSSVPWTLWFDGANYNPISREVSGKSGAGSSGTRTMEARGQPRSGQLNGLPSIVLDGKVDYLQYFQGSESAEILGNAAWTIAVTGKIHSAPTSDTEPYKNPSLGGCSNANFALDVRGDGSLHAYQFFGGMNRVASEAWTQDAIAHIQARFDGSTLSIRRGKGAWASVASGQTAIGGTFKIGTNYNVTQFLGVEVGEYGVTNVALSDQTLDSIADEMSSKWGAP